MKTKIAIAAQLAVIALFFSLPDRADAQSSRSIVIDQNAVVVWGGRIAFLNDGGCTAQPECTIGSYLDGGFVPLDGVRCESTARPIGAARCNVARTMMTNAAALDMKLGDGGAP